MGTNCYWWGSARRLAAESHPLAPNLTVILSPAPERYAVSPPTRPSHYGLASPTPSDSHLKGTEHACHNT
jgi:hypothetical protein